MSNALMKNSFVSYFSTERFDLLIIFLLEKNLQLIVQGSMVFPGIRATQVMEEKILEKVDEIRATEATLSSLKRQLLLMRTRLDILAVRVERRIGVRMKSVCLVTILKK